MKVLKTPEERFQNLKDFNFICVNSTASNRYEYDDYVYTYVAKPKLPVERWVGTPQEWRDNEIEIEW